MEISSKTTNREHTLTHFNKSNQMLKSASIQYASEKRSYPYFVAVGITAMAVQILEGLQLFLQSVYKIVESIVVKFNKDNIRNSIDDALTSLLLTFFKVCNVATRLLFSFVAPSIAIGCCELSDSQIQAEQELDDLLANISSFYPMILDLHERILSLLLISSPLTHPNSNNNTDNVNTLREIGSLVRSLRTFFNQQKSLLEKLNKTEDNTAAVNIIPHRKKDILQSSNQLSFINARLVTLKQCKSSCSGFMKRKDLKRL